MESTRLGLWNVEKVEEFKMTPRFQAWAIRWVVILSQEHWRKELSVLESGEPILDMISLRCLWTCDHPESASFRHTRHLQFCNLEGGSCPWC